MIAAFIGFLSTLASRVWSPFTLNAVALTGNYLASATSGYQYVVSTNSTTWQRSADGITWTTFTGPTAPIAFASNGTTVVCASGGKSTVVYSSTNHSTWTARTISANSQSGSGVVWNGTQFVAHRWADTSNFYTSTDGVTWSAAAEGWQVGTTTDVEGRRLQYVNGRYMLFSDNPQYTDFWTASTFTGANWTKTALPYWEEWCGVVYGNGKYLAYGLNNYGFYGTSTDSITWTQQNFPVALSSARGSVTTSTSGLYQLQYGPAEVAFVDGKFMFYRSNNIYTSPDGITWTIQTATADMLQASKIFSTPDGIILVGTKSTSTAFTAATQGLKG